MLANTQNTQNRSKQNEVLAAAIPLVDVIEHAEGVTLLVDLPGVHNDDLQLELKGHKLQLEARAEVPVSEGMTADVTMIPSTRYRRNFKLAEDLDSDSINASLTDGVLKIDIAKTPQAVPRRIAVNPVS